MGTLWIPGAERLPCSLPGGVITSDAEPRAVWHTVEGTSGSSSAWTSSIRTLNAKKAEPHILYDPVTDRIGQFMPLNVSARALKNDGATRTNRVGRVCIQIEVIAFSAKPFTAYWRPGKNFKALVAALRSWGIAVDVWPAGPPPKFIASPPHNVPENPRNRKTWLTKGGYYSHSQIPANDHGDPGGVDTHAMAAAGAAKSPTDTTTEDELSASQVQQILNAIAASETRTKQFVEARTQAYAAFGAKHTDQVVRTAVGQLLTAIAADDAPQIQAKAAALEAAMAPQFEQLTTAQLAAVQPADLEPVQAELVDPETQA